jgi:hypothetical protein
MGTITRSLANNITTGGVILPAGITNSSVSAVTSFANAPAGTLTLLSTQTASNSASVSFTTGLDSTYDEYQFKFINIAPRTDSSEFQFNFSTDGGSNYNVTKTTTVFIAYHTENDAETILTARNEALAQSTAFQIMSIDSGNDADQNLGGFLELYNPSSTTYVKHFISRVNYNHQADYSIDSFTSGYGNTTSAINAIQFKMDSGNMDGIIKMYGVKKS